MVKKAVLRSCAEKRRYPDEAEALRFAVSRPGRKSGDAPQRAYPCRICSGWHLSSKPLAEAEISPRIAKRDLPAVHAAIVRKAKGARKRPRAGQKKR